MCFLNRDWYQVRKPKEGNYTSLMVVWTWLFTRLSKGWLSYAIYPHTHILWFWSIYNRPIARGFGMFGWTALTKKSSIILQWKYHFLNKRFTISIQKVHCYNHTIILSIIYFSFSLGLNKILWVFSSQLCLIYAMYVIDYGFWIYKLMGYTKQKE